MRQYCRQFMVRLMMTLMTMIKMIFAADHGPLTVMVRTDEGVRYWGSGELVGPAPDLNNTQVIRREYLLCCRITIYLFKSQEDVINQQERGFRLNYTLTPC